jgi:cytochrome o ubiquinol oxidase subunit 2
MVVMRPSGDIASQQANLIVVSTLLMLLIIVPVLVLTLVFAWRYRQSNTQATYTPDWDHSTSLELVIWGAPLLIVIALGLLTWISTHTLDPYRPLQRLDAQRVIPVGTEELTVEVVALDWKWLFIYPELGIASVNALTVPVDVPIHFKITASTVMNSFYIPALAGQIYAMPGMATQLHAVINQPGTYDGFSANFSGPGFSGMHFKFQGMSKADFAQWVHQTQAGAASLGRADYLRLEKPSANTPVQHFAKVLPQLFDAVVDRCVEPGKMCMSQMMAVDARGGTGLNSFEVASHPSKQAPDRRYVRDQLCTAQDSFAFNDRPEPATPQVTHD